MSNWDNYAKARRIKLDVTRRALGAQLCLRRRSNQIDAGSLTQLAKILGAGEGPADWSEFSYRIWHTAKLMPRSGVTVDAEKIGPNALSLNISWENPADGKIYEELAGAAADTHNPLYLDILDPRTEQSTLCVSVWEQALMIESADSSADHPFFGRDKIGEQAMELLGERVELVRRRGSGLCTVVSYVIKPLPGEALTVYKRATPEGLYNRYDEGSDHPQPKVFASIGDISFRYIVGTPNSSNNGDWIEPFLDQDRELIDQDAYGGEDETLDW